MFVIECVLSFRVNECVIRFVLKPAVLTTLEPNWAPTTGAGNVAVYRAESPRSPLPCPRLCLRLRLRPSLFSVRVSPRILSGAAGRGPTKVFELCWIRRNS